MPRGKHRTAHGPTGADPDLRSYIESDDPHDEDGFCGFCRRDPAPDVVAITYSRNGFQAYPLLICSECRQLLVEHLERGSYAPPVQPEPEPDDDERDLRAEHDDLRYHRAADDMLTDRFND